MKNEKVNEDEYYAEDLLESLSKYLIIEISDVKYAFNISNIREIILLPKITPFPESLHYERGILKLRNNIIRVIDLRKRLNFPSLLEEDEVFLSMLMQRKQDHINWLNELIASVDENRTFNLTNDPTQCAFGKWYYNYKATNISMAIYLAQFDHPHKIIHGIADKVKECVAKGDFKNAKKIINDTKDKEFALMIELFDNIHQVVRESHREIGIVFENENWNDLICFSSDKVHSIAHIEIDSVEHPNSIKNKDYIKGIAKSEDDVYIILDESKLF